MGRAVMLAAGCCLVFWLCVCHVEAQYSVENTPFVWPVWDYPDPHSLDARQHQLCRRSNVSSVCDPNGIIQPHQADAIDVMINEVYRNTTCLCLDCRINNHGYIIRVALMPRMERILTTSNSSRDRLIDAKMYSYILSRKWKLNGACNETLLILYSRYDDILFTLTRETTRVRLTDNDITIISLAVRHYFDEPETIADGIMEMIRRYRLVFESRLSEAYLPSSGTNRRRTG